MIAYQKRNIDMILLILPPVDSELNPQGNSSTGAVVHSNICSLAAISAQIFPEIEVRVIDGEAAPEEVDTALKKVDDKTLVGISCSIMNYGMARKIGKISKRNGAYVVVGGQYASLKGFPNLNIPSGVHDLILFNPNAYHVGVCGMGELTFVEIIKLLRAGGKTPKYLIDIPNLCFWHNEKIVETEKILPDLNKLPMPDRDFLRRYFSLYKMNQRKNMREVKPSYQETLKITVWSALGCPKALGSVCTYCSIPYAGQFQQKTPHSFWKEAEYLYGEYGQEVLLYDVCDDMTGESRKGGTLGLLRKLCNAKPTGLESRHRVYARPDGITDRSISHLLELGVEEIFIGVESMSPIVLTRSGRAMKPDASRKAIQLLSKTDIICNLGTIWGLRGETEESVHKTLEFLRRCFDLCSLLYVNTGYSIPYRGSWDWALLYTHAKVGRKYCSKEFRDNPILTHREGIYDFHRLFSPNVTFEHLDRVMEIVRELSPIKISMHRTLGVPRYSEYEPYDGPLTRIDPLQGMKNE